MLGARGLPKQTEQKLYTQLKIKTLESEIRIKNGYGFLIRSVLYIANSFYRKNIYANDGPDNS